MNNSQNTYTVTVGIIAAVLVFVLFVVIIMTQGYGTGSKIKSSTQPRVESSMSKKNSAKSEQTVKTSDQRSEQKVEAVRSR